MIKLIGLLGGLCFAYCGVPAAYKTVKAGKSIGAPVSISWMITLGGILTFTYLWIQHGFDGILALNYTVEVMSWGTIVKYHYFPTRP